MVFVTLASVVIVPYVALPMSQVLGVELLHLIVKSPHVFPRTMLSTVLPRTSLTSSAVTSHGLPY